MRAQRIGRGHEAERHDGDGVGGRLPLSATPARSRSAHVLMRGWRNTVEIVLFEISNSMKPYPSVVHA